MSDSLLFANLSFIISCILFLVFIPVSHKIGLVDKPGDRKSHLGEVPLIGGLVIYISTLIGLPCIVEVDQHLGSYLVATGILVLVGAIDDRFGLDYRIRIIAEVIAAAIMIRGAGLFIGNIGNLLGFGEIHMAPWAGYIFTLIAVFGVVNAINMLDGLDGLAGGFCLVAIAILILSTGNSNDLNLIGPLIVGSLAAFLLFNLDIFPTGEKSFLGDAGSKFLGFTLVWFLIDVAKSGSNIRGGIDPATALYFVGVPLFDMVAITLRRVRQGLSPFQPDRRHIHHVFLMAGFSHRKTVIAILVLDLLIKILGITLSKFNVYEYIQFSVFFLLFIIYFYFTYRAENMLFYQPVTNNVNK